MIIVCITGNLGADAELREIDGRKFISFRMCSTEKRNGKDYPTWVTVRYRDNPNLLPYLKKGASLLVNGEMRITTIKDNDGHEKTYHDVFANIVTFNGGKPHTQAQGNAPQPVKNPQMFDDNELPF